jgi:type II secretory pathway pseudopilin PulG
MNDETNNPEVSKNTDTASNETVPIEKNKKLLTKKKKYISISIVLAIALILFLFSIKIREDKARKEYQANINLISTEMINGASQAETNGNLILNVWGDAIQDFHNDPETKKYIVKDDGTYYGFNSALSNLFSDDSYKKDVDIVKGYTLSVNDLMKKLKNPSKEYEEAYDQVKSTYNAYIEFTSLINDPTGSYSSFSEAFNSKDTALSSEYQKLQLYITDADN